MNWDTRVKGDAMLLGVMRSANRTREYIQKYTTLRYLDFVSEAVLTQELARVNGMSVSHNTWFQSLSTSDIRQITGIAASLCSFSISH